MTITALIFKRITGSEATQKINQLLKDGHKTMGQDRKWSDIIAHILLACAVIGLSCTAAGLMYTGIGLVALSVPVGVYGAFFLNSTKRQKELCSVSQEAKQLFHNAQSASS